MIDPLSAAGVVIAALALAHQVLKSPDVSKADKKKIAKEAESLVKLAQMSDIDREARKAKIRVDEAYHSQESVPLKKILGHRRRATKKVVSKKAATGKKDRPAKESAKRRPRR